MCFILSKLHKGRLKLKKKVKVQVYNLDQPEASLPTSQLPRLSTDTIIGYILCNCIKFKSR